MTYALDTNVIVNYLNGESAVMEQLTKAAKSNARIVIPSIVDYEIMRGFYYAPKPRKEAVYRDMRLSCRVAEANAAIWDCAARLWADTRKLKLMPGDADLLIAAVCIVNGYALVTNNVKHFKDIKDLRFVNWMEI